MIMMSKELHFMMIISMMVIHKFTKVGACNINVPTGIDRIKHVQYNDSLGHVQYDNRYYQHEHSNFTR